MSKPKLVDFVQVTVEPYIRLVSTRQVAELKIQVNINGMKHMATEILRPDDTVSALERYLSRACESLIHVIKCRGQEP